MGISSVEGVDVNPASCMSPCLSVLPMGFSWSLVVAQRAVQNIVESNKELSCERALENQVCGLVLDEERPHAHYTYVDNVGVLGLEAERVSDL